MIIETNIVLGAALLVFAEAAGPLQLPPKSVPASAAELSHIRIAASANSLSVSFRTPDGSSVWVQNGALKSLITKDSYFQPRIDQDAARAPVKLNWSAEAAGAKARNFFLTLQKSAAKLTNFWVTNKTVKAVAPSDSRYVLFQFKEIGSRRTLAQFEVDRVSGETPFLSLDADQFQETNWTLTTLARGVRGLPKPSPANDEDKARKRFPRPTAAELKLLFSNAERLGSLVEIPTAPLTPAAIDWQESGALPNDSPLDGKRRVFLKFLDGGVLGGIDGLVFNLGTSNIFTTPDFQSRTREQLARYRGQINHEWPELAKRFSKRMAESLRLPDAYVGKLQPFPMWKPPEKGSDAPAILPVNWLDFTGTDYETKAVPLAGLPVHWTVEFDLRDGSIAAFLIRHNEAWTHFKRAQNRSNTTPRKD